MAICTTLFKTVEQEAKPIRLFRIIGATIGDIGDYKCTFEHYTLIANRFIMMNNVIYDLILGYDEEEDLANGKCTMYYGHWNDGYVED